MSDSFDEVDEAELFLALGGSLSKLADVAGGPVIDGIFLYNGIKEHNEIVHDTERIKANTDIINSSASMWKQEKTHYETKKKENKEFIQRIESDKAELEAQGISWPDFVKYINSGKWKE